MAMLVLKKLHKEASTIQCNMAQFKRLGLHSTFLYIFTHFAHVCSYNLHGFTCFRLYSHNLAEYLHRHLDTRGFTLQSSKYKTATSRCAEAELVMGRIAISYTWNAVVMPMQLPPAFVTQWWENEKSCDG